MRYSNLPSSFYRDTEKMFRLIVQSLNESGEGIWDKEKDRLQQLLDNSIATDGDLHEILQYLYLSYNTYS